LSEYLLHDSPDQTLVFGPVLRRPDVAGCYFMVAGAGLQGFRCDQVLTGEEDYERAEARRGQVIGNLGAQAGGGAHHAG
jgi:hypothetical protein